MIENLQQELKHHLDKDERLIWTDKPKYGIVFKSSDIFFSSL